MEMGWREVIETEFTFSAVLASTNWEYGKMYVASRDNSISIQTDQIKSQM